MYLLLVAVTFSLNALGHLSSIHRVALSEGVDSQVLASVCWVESKFNPRALAVRDGGKPASSIGICQVQYKTAQFMGFRGRAAELYTIDTNLSYAAKYLKYQLKRYGDLDSAIAAYNAGAVYYDDQGNFVNQSYVKKVRTVMVLFKESRLPFVGSILSNLRRGWPQRLRPVGSLSPGPHCGKLRRPLHSYLQNG